MKAVLISIQPKWCELIASGKKTIEVRKTRPKIETPFKCYIYRTTEKVNEIVEEYDSNFKLLRRKKTLKRFSGKVIGEFVCDRIICCQAYYDDSGKKHLTNLFGVDTSKICLSELEIFDYIIGKDKKDGVGWLWHISDLKIYDKPKELGEFKKAGFMTEEQWLYALYPNTHCHYEAWAKRFEITHPPQSWCYVEEI